MSNSHSAELGRLEAWVAKNSSWLALGIIAAAFLIRLYYASCCYFNPDEAVHFSIARPNSWIGAYRDSRLGELSHPPFFILVLHGMMFLGRTELILRLPSLIGGTASLWVVFAWIRRVLGEIPAVAGLGFMAISHGAISASTEVREYGILLFFVCASLYAAERALAEPSTFWAIIQGVFLMCALITDYTAIVVIASLSLYALLRWLLDNVPRRVFFTLGTSYAVLGAWLYGEIIRRSIPYGPAARMPYLANYYYSPGHETQLGFLWRMISGTFTYELGGRRSSFLIALVFLAGLSALLKSQIKSRKLMATLVFTPFAVGIVAGACQIFPFIGSRHQAYLLPFLAFGIASAFIWLNGRMAIPIVMLGVLISPFWIMHTAPDNDCRVQSIEDMARAIEYINRAIPRGTVIFVDDETRQEFRYYFARDDASLDAYPQYWQGVGDNSEEHLGGYRVIKPRNLLWAFRGDDAFELVSGSARFVGLSTRDPLWIVSVAWLEPSLASRLSNAGNFNAQEFGRISVIKLSAWDQVQSTQPITPN